jgi:uncharacterized protein (DUF2252 family)
MPLPDRIVPTSFVLANAAYERWLGARVRLVRRDLDQKHGAMAEGAFQLLRATFFRWAQRWPVVCPELAGTPKVLAVGDLHVENFGTWRDSEGRLVWGVNDFDEAWPLPYSSDLVRLATSAMLAAEEHELSLDEKEVCEALLEGYTKSLETGGRPFVLAEHHEALSAMAVERLKSADRFWEKLERLPSIRRVVPAGARKALQRMFPDPAIEVRYVHRIAGLGSLGRQRVAAIGDWHGGKVAREAKAAAPSAAAWAAGIPAGDAKLRYQDMIDRAVRCPDPFLRLKRRWIVRRLAPDCARIELAALPRERDEKRLLSAMGWETANVHLGSAPATVLRSDLKTRRAGWLVDAARRMTDDVEFDFDAWRRHRTQG